MTAVSQLGVVLMFTQLHQETHPVPVLIPYPRDTRLHPKIAEPLLSSPPSAYCHLLYHAILRSQTCICEKNKPKKKKIAKNQGKCQRTGYENTTTQAKDQTAREDHLPFTNKSQPGVCRCQASGIIEREVLADHTRGAHIQTTQQRSHHMRTNACIC